MITLIIDGNNVFRALGVWKDPAAEGFLQELEMAAIEKDWQVMVVFDGPARYLPRETGPLIVQYGNGRQADTLIERMVYEAKDRFSVIVVTRDYSVADVARGFGARSWLPDMLKQEIDSK